MTHRRPSDYVVALLVTVAVNVVGILLLIRIQAVDEAERPAAGALRTVSLSTTASDRRPPPPPTPIVPTRASRRSPSRILPVPQAESVVSSMSLSLPDFDPTRIIDPLADRLPLATNLEGLLQVEEVVDEAPRVVKRVQPQYPLSAELMGTTGRVVVRLRVSETGRVTEVQVMRSEPPGVFDDATVRAIERWEFTPAVYRGQAVPTWCRTSVVFTLEEAPR